MKKRLLNSKRQTTSLLACGEEPFQGINLECGSPHRVARDTGRDVTLLLCKLSASGGDVRHLVAHSMQLVRPTDMLSARLSARLSAFLSACLYAYLPTSFDFLSQFCVLMNE